LLTGLSPSAQSPELSVKEMFYNTGGAETVRGPTYLPDARRRLREVNYMTPLRHCGIHYWFEDSQGVAYEEGQARRHGGRVSLLIRASCNGFLTVFDLTADRTELTPRTDQRWSGLSLGDQLFRVPGDFELGTSPTKRLIIVWARSQTEVARDAAHAPTRLRRMTEWAVNGRVMVVRAVDEATPGEIGNYVVNRADAGVAAEVRFAAR
jgi:hypothetical protein